MNVVLTPATFKRKALSAFRRANPTAKLTIEWRHAELAPGADGVTRWCGVGTASAVGHRSRTVIATANPDGSGMMVR